MVCFTSFDVCVYLCVRVCVCVCLLKGVIKDIKGSEVKLAKKCLLFFQLFICCTLRNTCSFYAKVVGQRLPVHWPLLIVKIRKSQIQNILTQITMSNIGFIVNEFLVSVLTIHIDTCTNAERFHLET